MAPDDARQLFLSQLDVIERIVGALCRRHGVAGDDASDFGSWVKLRLIENDYAVIRKFRGESSLATYLTVVIAMLFRDYRVQRWGRWRPSAAARREGTLAVRLETLVYRDGHRLEQAADILRTAGQPGLSDREVVALFRRLPRRVPRPRLDSSAEPAEGVPAVAGADDALLQSERATDQAAANRVLTAALEALATEDRLVVRMHFWEGLSIADIARALGLPQKPLYRRMERALATIRARLVQSGATDSEAREALNEWTA